MAATIQDIFAGRPVIYTMFLGYDEVAHHSGTERPDALVELEKIDRAFGRLERAIQSAPRPYKIVILADHGQSQGYTFKQRQGQTLEELVKQLTSASTSASGQGEEGWGYASAAASEITHKTRNLGNKRDESGRRRKNEDDSSEVVVMPSGGLASICFTKLPGRVSLETINQYYPNLIDKIVNNENIAFALVKSDEEGNMAIGKHGINYLDKDKVEGSDPLSAFGPNSAAHVRRTASFPHCPDIVINSNYWDETGEVAAFEELVGSHGAMGGAQQFPFILYPADFKGPKERIVGAETVHKQFRHWLAGLGWESYN